MLVCEERDCVFYIYLETPAMISFCKNVIELHSSPSSV